MKAPLTFTLALGPKTMPAGLIKKRFAPDIWETMDPLMEEASPPVTLAMTAMTMDHLTGGRVLLGIGTSNPQVVEGWYGQPYPRPLERTREYIDILRLVIAREQPVAYDGRHYQLPLRSGTGLGKPLRSITL